MEESLIVLLVALILGGPIVALILSIVALVRGGRVRKELRESHENLRKEVDHLRTLLRRTDERIVALEQPGAAAAPPGVPPPPAEAAPPAAVPQIAPSPPGTPEAKGPAPAAPAPTAAAPPPLPAASPAKVPSKAPAPATGPTEAAAPSKQAKRKMGLEERLGARLFVWVGAIALALAGAFFVKYSIDQGWISPPVRVALGLVFGAGLLLAGELLRRNYSHLAQGCSAAGVADLFACFLASTNLYHLIPSLLGFFLMGLTAAVAVALSLRQGPLVAVVGLIGGFFTPYWLSTGSHRPGPLFAYLLLLQIGLLVVTRRRRWWPLAGLTLLAGMGWAAMWLAVPFRSGDALWVGLFLLMSVGAFLASGFVGGASEAWGDVRIPIGLGWSAMGSGVALLAALVGVGGFGTTEWVFLGILGAACLAMGRLDAAFEGTAWLSAVTSIALLGVWGFDLAPEKIASYLATAGGLGALYVAGAYACLWGSRAPGRWAALSAVSALGVFLVAWRTHVELFTGAHWGPPALVLALLFLAGALPVASRRRTMPGAEAVLAGLAAAVTAFVSLAVPLELEREWMAVAWAFEVAALCWLAERLRVETLAKLAWALAIGVAVRLLMNPFVLTYPSGENPVFNWILYGYGLPALAFAAGAFLAVREHPRFSEALQWGAIALTSVMLALETRHYFHPGRLNASKVDLVEWGAWAVLWMALGMGLLLASRRWPLRSLDWGGRLLFLLALGVAGLGPCLAANPAWTHHPVGATPIFNALLFVYGVPAVLVLMASRELMLRGEKILPRVYGVGGLVLLFFLLTLEIRQGFRGTLLHVGSASSTENYAYSAGWILYGLALLAVGIVRESSAFRWASLAVMILTIAKIFLYDIGKWSDTLQISLSMASLGGSLLLIAFLYMRFVFRRREP